MNSNEDTSKDTTAYNRRLMGNVVRLPMVVDTAKDGLVHDAETGKMLLDFWGDEGVCSLGYNSPEYMEAVHDFYQSGAPHQLPDVFPQVHRFQAAETICDRTGMDRIFFCNSGTEANEAAIKIARKHFWDRAGRPMEFEEFIGDVSGQVRNKPSETKAQVHSRHIILTLEGNFHGRTGLSLAACDPRVSPYHRHGFGPVAQGFGVIDGDFQQVVTDGTEHKPRGVEWHKVAAVILAPVLGNNLVKTYPKEFWEALGRMRDEKGFLIIHDDVQAGNGRTGGYATYQAVADKLFDGDSSLVKPDVVCLGKGMALGHPMSAMLASEGIAEAFTPGVHFNTFGGSPFACAMASYYYGWLDENMQRVRTMGAAIRTVFGAADWIIDHDGMGMLNAFRPDYERFGYDGYEFCHKTREHGLILVTHRQYGPIRFTPPMNTSESDVQRAFEIMDQVHQELAEG